MSADKHQQPERKAAKISPLSPRNWHGMTAGVWFPFYFGHRCATSPSRLGLVATISAASLMNSALRGVSETIYRRRANAVPFDNPPVFVIGHWRTGTTWMHELLARDKRFSFPTTYQCNCPHHFLLTETLFSPCLNLLLPKRRPMDDMPVGMYRPQEDEFALMNLGVGSPYLDWAYPAADNRYLEYLTLQALSDQDQQRWREGFEWFLRRLALRNPNRLILKSPTHTARISTLLKMFPDARFIHMVRNPLSTISSTLRTWTDLTEALAIRVRREPIPVERIFALFEAMYDQFFQEQSLIPPANLFEVRYEDLVADPIAILEQIYQQLELGDFQVARPAVAEYLGSISEFRPSQYKIDPALKQQIFDRCQTYIQQYGYSDAWNAESEKS
jgi:hypothetical protein